MPDINLAGPVLDVTLMVAAAIVVVILFVHLSLKASHRRVAGELRKGAILNGLQYLPAESEKVLTASDGTWDVVHCYRTPKGSFFVYRAAFGPLGWKRSKFQTITKDEAMEMLGAKDIRKFTEIFGKPKKA